MEKLFKGYSNKNTVCPLCKRDVLVFRDIYNTYHTMDTINQVPIQSMICRDCRIQFRINWVNGVPYPLLDNTIVNYINANV